MQVAEGGTNVALEWAARHEGAERPFSGQKNLMPVHKLKALPKQNNYTDCGLFLLAYLQYFACELPPPDLDIHRLIAEANAKGTPAANRMLEGGSHSR